MEFIKNIKLKKFKGIKECVIKELGHINVICGKNNSGKTSIMSAISSFKFDQHERDQCSVDIGEKNETMNALKQKIISAMGFNDTSPWKRHIDEHVNAYYENVLDKEEIWFCNNHQVYVEKIYKYFNQQMRNPSLIAYNNMKYVFREYFQEQLNNFNPILIDAKRVWDPRNKIETGNITVSNGGGGLVNRLLHISTQPNGTPENDIYRELKNAFEIVTDCDFNVKTISGNRAELNFKSATRSEWDEPENSGIGLWDVLCILYFSLDDRYNFLMIEEPENHLHPEMQKRLLSYIKDIKDKQFLFSTHSSVFVDPYRIDSIYYVENNGEVVASNETSQAVMLKNLGYSVAENIVHDVVVLTEGPTDVPILQFILEKMGIYDKYSIKFWFLSGDNMKHFDLETIDNKKVIALVDKEKQSKEKREEFEKRCKQHSVYCHVLERYSIELYLPLYAIRKVIGKDFPENLERLNHTESITSQLAGIKIKKRNYKVVQESKVEDFEGTDLYAFCEKVKEVCEAL